MKILDNHVHTHFSIDAKDTMEDVIKRAIDIGVDYLTFTDHLEYNTDHFSLDIPQYISKIAEYLAFKSESGAYRFIKDLENLGFLTKNKND